MRAQVLTSARAQYLDFAAVFAIRAFEIYKIGNILMSVGFWMQRIAIGWITWELTGSEFWLGLIALVELFPSILTALIGGQLADRHPSIRLMFLGQIASAPVSLALALGHAFDVLTPNLLLVVMVYFGVVSGGILSARLAIASWLTPRPLLPTALAVNSTGFNLSRFVAFAVALYLIRDTPRQGSESNTAAPVSTAQGVLMRPESELFLAYATTIFRGGETALGLLNAAVGLGAVAGALALSKAREERAAVVQIFDMSTLFPISMLLSSMKHVLWPGLLLLFIY